MRSLLFAVMFSVMGAVSASAQQAEIEGTITEQIEAFKADDFAAAFQFAAPGLQAFFRSPENFRRMVTEGYPMVWRPAEVEYLELKQQGPAFYQIVRIVDGEGAQHYLVYRMITTSGGWRIAGVQILDAPGVSA